MVANDTSKQTDFTQSDREEPKTMLRNIRYINRKESVMCILHVDNEEQDNSDSQTEISTETDSDSETSSVKCYKPNEESKPERPKRKSVRFVFEDKENSDLCVETSSIVSEPVRPSIKSVYHRENYKDDSSLPPLKGTTKAHSDRYKAKWPGKKNPDNVPKHMFETLNTLGLSPRVKRKMSLQTLSDIKAAITQSRESLKKDKEPSHLRQRKMHHRILEEVSTNLNVIPESESSASPRLLPRRLAPVYPKLPTYSSNFVASDAEAEKLEFIKKALSPMPDIPSQHDAPRDRAATISGGEKRSWIMHRRNSREDIGSSWINPLLTKNLQSPKKDIPKVVKQTDGWFSDLPKTGDGFDFARL